MISSEVESLARTGGLGDVVAALSLALAELGEDVVVVTPLYGVTTVPSETKRWYGAVEARHGWGADDVRQLGVVELETSRFPSGGTRRICLIDDPALFGRAGIYGDANGAFGDNDLHLPREAFRPEILWHRGNVNLLKGATALADRITTVSPTYAQEILTPELGFGLDEHLRAHHAKLTGILNGIDDRFDPRTDDAIAQPFDATSVAWARAANKAALAKEVALDAGDGPLFGCVTRLTWQKGIDLLVPMLGEIVERGGRVLLVGQGDGELESSLLVAAERFRGRVAVRIAFDSLLSRRVYAGADFFFVPSRFEPCGLTQLYAMRYGAIPIVTNVGGLHDTVAPIDAANGRGTGFVAAHADVPSLRAATIAAFELWRDRGLVVEASVRGMGGDFSWTLPAERYRTLFAEAAASL